jgi:hypothetical protein
MTTENPAENEKQSTTPKQASYTFEHVFWIFLLLACVPIAFTLYDGTRLLFVDYETNRPEVFNLHGAQQITRGKPLYMPFGKIPYIVHVYNQLTYLPAGLVGRIFDLDLKAIRLVGRLFCYASTLLLSVVLFLWIRRDTGNWKPAMFAALGIYFFHVLAVTEFFRLRSEPPGLLFTFAGAATFLSRGKYRLYLSAVLFFVAFLFKQVYIAAPLSAFLYLLLARDYRNALRFLAAMVVMLAVFFVTMYLWTGSNYFYSTIYALAVNDNYFLHHLRGHQRYILDRLYGPILCMPIALALLWVRRESLYLVVYFFVCLLWTHIAAGKIGSSFNYYSELTILTLVVIARALGSRGRGQLAVVGTIITILLFQVCWTIAGDGWQGITIQAAVEDNSAAIARYKSMPGRKLLIDERVAIHVGDVAGFDWYLLGHLEEKGVFDLTPLYWRIDNREYDVCVFPTRPHSVLEAQLQRRVRRAGYVLTYEDNAVLEYARPPAPRKQAPAREGQVSGADR